MSGMVRLSLRSLWIACIAGLVIPGAWIGAAQAALPYRVAVSVAPNQLQLQSVFKVTVSGNSANLSKLKVFLNKSVACKPTAAGDSAVAGDVLVISTNVVHAYVRTKSFTAASTGNHFACAYLTSVPPPSPTMFRARASAAYVIS